jgi:hypothetical protein
LAAFYHAGRGTDNNGALTGNTRINAKQGRPASCKLGGGVLENKKPRIAPGFLDRTGRRCRPGIDQ